MSWFDLYIQSGANDLNSGSTNDNTAPYTSTAGNWSTATNVFTPTDGQTTSSFVSVGDYVSIYATGAAATPFIAKVNTVGSGTNGTITVDGTLRYGTAPSTNSGSRNCKRGGAWATLSGPAAAGSPLNPSATAPQSTRINIAAATYAHTTTSVSLTLAGSATVGVWYRGYKTNIGDQDSTVNNAAVAGTDIPSLTWTTGTLTGSTKTRMSNLDISGSPTSALFTTGQSNQLYHVRCNNTSSNSAAIAVNMNTASTVATSCYFQCPTTATKVVNINSLNVLDGCVINGGTSGAAVNNQNTVVFNHCIFYGQAGDCILITTGNPNFVFNCSFYGPTGNGISITSTGVPLTVLNCYFENCNQASKAGINNSSGTNTDLIFCIGNAFYNCTSNTSGITESFAIFDNGTLATAGFVNGGSQNFQMTGVGKALGYPGTFETVSAYRGYLDIGAVQGSSTGVGRPHPGSGGII